MVDYVAKANSARLIRVSGTTLFQVAATYLNDATQWYRVAQLNGLSDPWINALTVLRIPAPLPTSVPSNDGFVSQTQPLPVTVSPSPAVTPTPTGAQVVTINITPANIAEWIAALPTVLPGAPGIAWNNGGVISIS